MNYGWTSDYHFSHFNIIRYCNHDRHNSLRTIISKVYIHYGSKDICMTHRAEDADPNVPWNFCGHVHEKYEVKRLNDKLLVVNLCVEVWNYYPVTFEEIGSAVSAFLKEEKNGEGKKSYRPEGHGWAGPRRSWSVLGHRMETYGWEMDEYDILNRRHGNT